MELKRFEVAYVKGGIAYTDTVEAVNAYHAAQKIYAEYAKQPLRVAVRKVKKV